MTSSSLLTLSWHPTLPQLSSTLNSQLPTVATPNGSLDAKSQDGTIYTSSNSTKNNSWFTSCANSKWSFATPLPHRAQNGASHPICALSLKRKNRSHLHSPTAQSSANVCTSLHAHALTFHMLSVNWHASCLTTESIISTLQSISFSTSKGLAPEVLFMVKHQTHSPYSMPLQTLTGPCLREGNLSLLLSSNVPVPRLLGALNSKPLLPSHLVRLNTSHVHIAHMNSYG